MKKKIAIYCRNVDRYIDVEGGETLLETAGRLSPELGFRPVCARVNNKTESLSYAVYQPKQVEFLSKTMASGELRAFALHDALSRRNAALSRGKPAIRTFHLPRILRQA